LILQAFFWNNRKGAPRVPPQNAENRQEESSDA